MNVWKTKVPLKIRIFLWQVINDKIQSAEQLKKRNWPGSVACKLCGLLESTSHIFFIVRLPVSAGVCVEMLWDDLFLPLMLLIFSTSAAIYLTNKPDECFISLERLLGACS
jgi:hypothetical protein